MKYAAEMASDCMTYIQSFMEIIIGIQAILSCCLKNLRGCNVSTIDGKDLYSRRSDGLRWHVCIYEEESYRSVQAFRSC